MKAESIGHEFAQTIRPSFLAKRMPDEKEAKLEKSDKAKSAKSANSMLKSRVIVTTKTVFEK
jgi:hypothetical protein